MASDDKIANTATYTPIAVTPVFGLVGAVTVISISFVISSFAVTVIVAFPALNAFILPDASTLIIF